jgi:FPC/CPF motif-containing protein YcgG
VEQVPEESKNPAETAFVGEVAEAETTTEAPKKEVPVVQEKVTEEYTEVMEEIITETKDETIECIDEGDQSLAEYKPQIGGQPNPFENDTLTEIDDRPVEDYIGEGEDRPGEGIHF